MYIYNTLKTIAMKGRCPYSKGVPIANNTRVYIEKDTSIVKIKLHNTFILYAYPDGRVQLFTGGWTTVTTKERLNRYTSLGIYSNKRIWYVPRQAGLFKDQPIEFTEGYTICS